MYSLSRSSAHMTHMPTPGLKHTMALMEGCAFSVGFQKARKSVKPSSSQHPRLQFCPFPDRTRHLMYLSFRWGNAAHCPCPCATVVVWKCGSFCDVCPMLLATGAQGWPHQRVPGRMASTQRTVGLRPVTTGGVQGWGCRDGGEME